MTKLSLSPVMVPTGELSSWARPQLRFVFSLAHYNETAKNNMYSPYLSYTGPKDWGYYFGVKAEWWIW
jgi:maltoporin